MSPSGRVSEPSLTWPRRVRRVSFVLVAVGALWAAPLRPARAAAPAVELIETVPAETHIGNPDLRSAHDVWRELIQGARRSLDFEEFYCSDWPGEPLHDVLEDIGQAAARGVKVRLLLDAGMHRTYPQPADSLGRIPGIEVRTVDFHTLAGGVQHAKFFLVDGAATVLGSQNMDWRALKHIHELGVCVRDAGVTRVFQDVFEQDWATAGAQRLAAQAGGAASRIAPPAGDGRYPAEFRLAVAPGDTAVVRPSYSPKGWLPDSSRWDLPAIVRLLDSAKSEIVLQLLTYSPEERGRRDEPGRREEALQQALIRAAGRGVHVKMVISDWSTGHPGLDYLRTLARTPNIEVKISTVPEWSGGYIPFARVEHCKYVVVDTAAAWVGTSNWEPGYFYGTRNVAVTLVNRGLAAQARRAFEGTWSSAIAAPLRMDEDYPAKQRGDTPPPGVKKYGG